MQPIQELLHRIKWDAGFGSGSFAIGYEDRVAGKEQLAAVESIAMDPERPDAFSLVDEDGIVAHIPFHRVRTVYRNGVVIWRRPERPAP